MTVPVHSTFAQWSSQGRLSQYVRSVKSSGGFLNLIEAVQPPGDMSAPAVQDLVLYQDLAGGSRVRGDLGSGRFDVITEQGSFLLAAPDFANTVLVDAEHQHRGMALAFPLAQWTKLLEGALNSDHGFDYRELHVGVFNSPGIRSALRELWRLCDEEGAPSRLLAQAAGCEILAELYRLGGASMPTAKGGLAPWAERRCLELMHARLSEDISLEDLAAEARLSPFHFARMFKQSVGVPPRVYLTKLRVEKACELLEQTDLPVTEIAFEVGYSSNQVLARVFLKHMRLSPTDYRRAVRDPVRSIAMPGASPA